MKYKELKKFHKHIDEQLTYERKICKKNCSFCCYQSIELMMIEDNEIIKYVNQVLSDQIREHIIKNLKVWFEAFNYYLSQHEYATIETITVEWNPVQAKLKLPCPLLFKGKCSIYRMRPISCRTHYANSDLKKCETELLRNDRNQGEILKEALIEFLATHADFAIWPLNLILAKELCPDVIKYDLDPIKDTFYKRIQDFKIKIF